MKLQALMNLEHALLYASDEADYTQEGECTVDAEYNFLAGYIDAIRELKLITEEEASNYRNKALNACLNGEERCKGVRA